MPSVQPAPDRVPRWRIETIGLYTTQDERDEERAITWAIMGRPVPRGLEVRHLVNPWHRALWWALLMVGAWEGKATPVRVARALRRGKAWGPWLMPELAELVELGAYVSTEPDWARIVERAEQRLKVLELERAAEDQRWFFTGQRAF